MPESQAKEIKVHYRKSIALWMTGGVIFLLCFLALIKFSALDSVENQTIDFRFGVRGQRAPQAPIFIVAVDEKSLQEIGRWPWPRSIQADLARKLKEAGVTYTFFDVMFYEPELNQGKMVLEQLEKSIGSATSGNKKAQAAKERILQQIDQMEGSKSGDEKLSEALGDVKNVFLPITPLNNDDGREPDPADLHLTPAEYKDTIPVSCGTSKTLEYAIPMLQKKALDSGHIRYFQNRDGILRYYSVVIQYKNMLIPHLSLQMARYLLGVQDKPIIVTSKYAQVGDRKIPMLDGSYAAIDYCGKKETFPYISACDILKDRVNKSEMQGKVAMIGATADGLFDLRPTPFTKANPGVEVNANILENIIANRFLTLAPEYIKYLLVVLLSMLIWYLVPRVHPIKATFYFALMFAVYVVIACVVFSEARLIIDMTYPLMSMLITFVLLTTYKFRTEVRHSRYMKQMFQSMVAPAVVDEIMKLPAGIELGGEEKELTVMFSDIRGFTTYSEKHTPHEVVAILNEYLTQMTNLIFQTEGTLDKYIGDAIMAFWGAPGAQKDHAYRSCSTALGMVDLLHTVLHPKWELEGKQRLDIGIGLNTGPMVVGFVGSQSIKNYTLIGDAVNLGARLEGTTKEYHVEIIIAESTYLQVKEDMLCRELDLIKVKGKNEPIRIYELIDHRLRGAGVKELKVKAFEEGLAHYRALRFDEAVKCFKNCLELDPKDGPAEIFVERSKVLKQNPPPAPWDGVFVMKTK